MDDALSRFDCVAPLPPPVYAFQYRTPYVAAGITPYRDLVCAAQTAAAKPGCLVEFANAYAGRGNLVRFASRDPAFLHDLASPPTKPKL